MSRSTITKALDIQEKHEGPSRDMDMLRYLLAIAKTASQWTALTQSGGSLRYGVEYYKVHTFYAPTPLLRMLIGTQTNLTPQPSDDPAITHIRCP